MRPPDAAELLDLWEQGVIQPPLRRGLTMAAAACPGVPVEELARQRIGRRNACLLTLREQVFGPHFTALATCPGCGEHLELEFQAADIRAAEDAEHPPALALCEADYEVHFRLPTSLDLAAVVEESDAAEARRRLLERCLLQVRRKDHEAPAGELPARIIDLVVERMAQADPQGDTTLSLGCGACGHRWEAAFEIASFLWTEIDAWAARTLRDVHALARAYGWGEAEILAMSPWRRRCYLDMAGG